MYVSFRQYPSELHHYYFELGLKLLQTHELLILYAVLSPAICRTFSRYTVVFPYFARDSIGAYTHACSYVCFHSNGRARAITF